MNFRKGLLCFFIVINSILLLFSLIGVFFIGEVSSTLFFGFFSLFFIVSIYNELKKINNPNTKTPKRIKYLLIILFALSIISTVIVEGINVSNNTAPLNMKTNVSEDSVLKENESEKASKELKVSTEATGVVNKNEESVTEQESVSEESSKVEFITTSSREVIENPTIIEKSLPTDLIKVYVGETGKKYHRKSCRTLKTSSVITEYSVADAKNKGYSACKVCTPPNN